MTPCDCCRHSGERQKLLQDIDSLKELIVSLERSIGRKDSIVNNMTDGIKRQRDKYDMMQKFCEWRLTVNDHKREVSAR